MFPSEFLIDYVRVYQRKGHTNIGCDPKDYPTTSCCVLGWVLRGFFWWVWCWCGWWLGRSECDCGIINGRRTNWWALRSMLCECYWYILCSTKVVDPTLATILALYYIYAATRPYPLSQSIHMRNIPHVLRVMQSLCLLLSFRCPILLTKSHVHSLFSSTSQLGRLWF